MSNKFLRIGDGISLLGLDSDPVDGVSGDIYYNSSTNMLRYYNGTSWQNVGSGSGGDVSGPGSSTDNAIARFDGTTGKIIQNSGASITDTGELSSTKLTSSTTVESIRFRSTGLASDPVSASIGDLYFSLASNKYRVYNGTIWSDLADIDLSLKLLTGYSSDGVVLAATDSVLDGFEKLDAKLNSVPKNYILNGEASVDTSGWATYADAASSVPVDGTGGSPTITLTRTTTTPLRNASSFLITKAAANQKGQGVSYDFITDKADISKVLTISFDYEVASGTFAYNGGTAASPSDLAVYVYDLTNNSIIYPSQSFLNGSGKFISQFQTNAGSTSYRLIFHIATDNALAWAFEFDAVEVGYRSISTGAVISDFIPYTATGLWTTNTTYDAKYRRVGDSLEAYVSVSLAGAPNAADFSVNLPSGLSIDVTKLSASVVGNARIIDTGVTAYNAVPVVAGNSIKLFYNQTASGTNPVNVVNASVVTNAAPFSFNSLDSISLYFKVPIQGWSSNVVLSNDYSSRIIAVRAIGTPTGTFNASSAIVFPTKDFDTTNSYNATTGIFTAPESGFYAYDVSIGVSSADANGGAFLIVQPYINGSGSSTTRFLRRKGGNLGTDTARANGQVRLNAGDTLQFRVDSNYASPSFVAEGTELSIRKIQSPQTLARTEVVAFDGVNTAATTVNTSLTTIPFTSVTDTHGSWVTNTYTITQSGMYVVSAGLSTAAVTLTTGQRFYVNIRRNAAVMAYARANGTGASNTYNVTASRTIYLNAGDTISVQAISDVSVALSTSAGECWLSISKV